MRRLLVMIVGLLLLGAAVAYVGGNLSFVDASCEYQVLEIEGQQFATLDDLKQTAQKNGASFNELDQQFDFRDPADGPVEFKSTGCGVEEVSPKQ